MDLKTVWGAIDQKRMRRRGYQNLCSSKSEFMLGNKDRRNSHKLLRKFNGMFSRKGTPIRVDIQYTRIIDTADRSHEFDNFDDSEHFDDSHRPDSFDKSDHFECQLYHDQSKKKKYVWEPLRLNS